MIFGWPQIVLSALIVLGIGNAIARYGQQKTDKYDLTDVLFAPAMIFGLLWWGGFYG